MTINIESNSGLIDSYNPSYSACGCGSRRYYTKAEIDEMFANVLSEEEIREILDQMFEEYIEGGDLYNLILSVIGDIYTKSEIDAILADYATRNWSRAYIGEQMAAETARTESEYLKDITLTINGTELHNNGEIVIEGGGTGGTIDISGKLDTTAFTQAMESETARTENTYAKRNEIPSLTGYATKLWVQNQGYLTEHQDISGKVDTSAYTAYTASTEECCDFVRGEIDDLWEIIATLTGSTPSPDTGDTSPDTGDTNDYLSLRIKNGGNLRFTSPFDAQTGWFSMYMKTNDGQWEEVIMREDRSYSVSSGDIIKLKGENLTYSGCTIGGENLTFDVYGNIMSLIYGDNYSGTTTLVSPYTFYGLFAGQGVVKTDALQLPATTLAPHCYERMFENCQSLVSTPQLPATTLEPYCYAEMFGKCYSLENNVPELQATTLASYCYYRMFYQCYGLGYGLNYSPITLPATALTEGCYERMFESCWYLKKTPELPATVLADRCYYGMFLDCKRLVLSTDILPATTAQDSCYYQMFNGCVALLNTPELPATTLDTNCYYEMFKDCSGLSAAPELPAATLAERCYMGMFLDCTNLVATPNLTATTLAYECYYHMFAGCTNLATSPELPATDLTDECYRGMFSGCTMLSSVPALPATVLAYRCYEDMFANCYLITQSPVLSAETLVEECYSGMFAGDYRLNTITCLAIDKTATNCLSNWVNGVAESGTFYKSSSSTWSSGVDGIPNNWTVEAV